jgi:hypothetical protein
MTPRTRKSRLADPGAGEPITRDTLVPAGTGELEVEQPDILPAQALDFFDYLNALSAKQWESRLVYLYRVDPEVRNPENTSGKSRKFIEKIAHAFDEEYVKKHHGGGGYLAILKNVNLEHSDRGERTKVFYIDGAPKLQPGQTLVGETGKPDVSSAPAGDTSIVELLKQVLADRSNTPEKAMEVFINTISKAQEASQSIMAKAAEKHADSTTGNPLLDRLLAGAIEKMTGAPTSQFDNLKQMVELVTLMRALNPEPKQPASLGLGGLKEVAELAGVESIADLFSKGGGGEDWRAVLARAGMSLIQNLPTMIDGMRQMQQENFQRALAVERARATGQIPPALQPVARPTAVHMPPNPLAQTPAPAPAANPMQAVSVLIAKMFDVGAGGDLVARMVKLEHPAVVPMLTPYLSAPIAEVKAFCASDEILSGITGHEDFDEFLEEFIAEMLDEEGEGPEGDGAPAPKKPAASVAQGPELVNTGAPAA